MTDWMNVTEASRELATEYRLHVTPHELSNMIYRRVLGPGLAHMIGGRRVLSRESLPMVADLLRQRRPVPDGEGQTELPK